MSLPKKYLRNRIFMIILSCCVFHFTNAQGIVNFGNMHLFTGGNIGTSIPFVNNATVGTDYVNDGNFFTSSHFANNKANMPAGIGTTIFNGTATQFLAGSSPIQFHHIIINNNTGGLQPLALNYTFHVAGNFTNNGVFTHNKSTLLFNGTTPDTINGTAAKTVLYNFSVSNPTSLSLAQNVDLLNAFSFKNVSNATLASVGLLTVKSSDTLTAQIADITDGNTLSGNNITGNVGIERYLFAKSSWRFLATPIALGSPTTITQSWRENNASLAISTGYGTRITGPGAIGVNGVDEFTQRGSLKYFNDASNNFTEIAATNAPIANSQGYFVFVRGDRSVAVNGTTGPTTLRMRGAPRMNNQSFTVLPIKFQSFGNPYASRIDFRNVTKTNVADAFTIWQPNNVGAYNVGGYETYVNISGDYWLNGITAGIGAKKRNFIESGEAAFIQSITGGSITIKEIDKAAGSALVSRTAERTTALSPTLDINLLAKNTTSPANDSLIYADAVSIIFDDAYSNAIDNDDVKKIVNSFDNITISKLSTNLVLECRPVPTNADTIKINLTGTRVGSYHFYTTPSLLQQLPANAFWVDKYLNTTTPLSLTNETDYAFSITTDAASKAADRFMVVFNQVVILPVQFIDIAAHRNTDKTNTIQWTIANEQNIQQYQIQRSDRGTNFVAIGNTLATHNTTGNFNYAFIDSLPITGINYYRIKAIEANGQAQYSAIVKVLIDNISPSISLYPNPITEGMAYLQFKNSIGNYTIKLMSIDGKEMQTTTVSITQNNELQTLRISKQVAPGNYMLSINNTNTHQQIKVVIK